MPKQMVHLESKSEVVELKDGTHGFSITVSGFPTSSEAELCSTAMAEPFAYALILALENMHDAEFMHREQRLHS